MFLPYWLEKLIDFVSLYQQRKAQQNETAGNDITSQTNLSEEELSRLANEAIQKSMQEDNVGNGSTVTAE